MCDVLESWAFFEAVTFCKAENWPASATVNADQQVTLCRFFSPPSPLLPFVSSLFLFFFLLQNSHYQDLQEQLGITCL